MRKTVCLLMILLFGLLPDPAQAQSVKSSDISIDVKNEQIKDVFKQITKSSNYKFFYDESITKDAPKITLKFSHASLNAILNELEKQTGFKFIMDDNTITVSPKNVSSQPLTQPATPKKYSGIVTDTKGEAIIGASIALRGTNVGTVTNTDGYFSIEASAGSTLVSSYLGYAPQEIKLGDKNTLDIVLQEDAKSLDEVVVIGYGTQRRSLVTSAISTFKPTENTRLVVNPGQMLDGTVPGVTIAQTSGNLGAGLAFNIRGTGSLNAGSNPLIVVDGIPLIQYNADITGFGESMSSLATLNTSDIESMEVLKDAASAAIYGSRATNGVVLITTKSGKAGKSKLDVKLSTGISQFANKDRFKMADSKLYLEVVNEGIDNFNRQMGYTPGSTGYLLHQHNPFGNLPDVDWLGLVLQTAYTYNADISISGGNDKTTYYIGGNYLSQDGVIKHNHLDKMSLKANLKHRLNKWIEVGANNSIVYTTNNRIPGSGLGTSTIGRTITQRPFDRPYKPNGDYYVGGTEDLTYHNMVQILNEETTTLDNLRYLGSISATINFMKNLSLKTSFSTDIAYTDDYLYYNENHPYGLGYGDIIESIRLYKSYLFENYANYNNKIGEDVSYDLMAGHSFQHTGYNRMAVERSDFPSPSFDVAGVGANILEGYSSKTAYAMESYFGRANASYKDRYLLSLTLRADGSSKFSRNTRWGYFPSASLGWTASNEDFWNWDRTDLKLRGSYGKTGNQEGIGAYAYQAQITGGGNYKNKSGIYISNYGNEDLRWETADQYDLGFDLALLNGKINMIADVYLKNTYDLLYSKPVPITSFSSSVVSNIGSIQNKGIEFAINGHFNIGKVKWTSSFNIAHNSNKLTKLLDNDQILSINSGTKAYAVGHEIGSWYMYKAVGIYQYDEEVPQGLYDTGVRAGDVKYEGDEDGVINSDDLRFVGSTNPKVAGGWNNTFAYNGWEFNFQFSYKFGQKVYNNAAQQSERIGGSWGLREVAALERWTGPGTSNTYPRAYNSFTHNYRVSTRNLEDGSFVRLRSATLSYNLPKQWMKKIGMNNVRLYVQGDNLLLFTGYTGYDPESMNFTDPQSQGYDNYIVPQPRTVTLGINATF